MIPLCLDQGIGVIPWSPLARGDARREPARAAARSTRPARSTDPFTDYLYNEGDFDVVDRVVEVAGERGVPPAQVALAWLLHRPGVTAPIVGATKIHHLEDAIAAEQLELSDDEIAAARGAVRAPPRARSLSDRPEPGPRGPARLSLPLHGCARRQRDLVSHPRRRRRSSPTSRSGSATASTSRSSARTARARRRCSRAIAGDVAGRRGQRPRRRRAPGDAPARRLARRGPHGARPAARALAAPRCSGPARELDAAEAADDARARASAPVSRWRGAHTAWGDAGGWDAEVLWDTCTTIALRQPLDRRRRAGGSSTLSGGEQKRLALEVLLRSDADVLLLDEPDNYLDVAGQAVARGVAARQPEDDPADQPRPGAARRRRRQGRHARGAHRVDPRRVVRDLARGARRAASPASTRTTAATARSASGWRSRCASSGGGRRWAATCSRRACARRSRRSSGSRRRRRPTACASEQVSMQLGGNRTGTRVIVCEQLELHGLTDPFDFEVLFGERIAVLGPERHRQEPLPAPARGRADRPRRHVAARRARRARLLLPDPRPARAARRRGRSTSVMKAGHDRGKAMATLRRYGLHGCRDPAVRDAVGRSAGPAADPAARAVRARTCCCSTSRPTTSTSRRPRRSRRRSTRSSAPSSRSPTTAGSSAASTASSRSAATARSASTSSRCFA